MGMQMILLKIIDIKVIKTIRLNKIKKIKYNRT